MFTWEPRLSRTLFMADRFASNSTDFPVDPSLEHGPRDSSVEVARLTGWLYSLNDGDEEAVQLPDDEAPTANPQGENPDDTQAQEVPQSRSTSAASPTHFGCDLGNKS